MKKSLLVLCALISMLICAGSLPAAATTLWYNGDADLRSGLINVNTPSYQAAVYDDFNVPSGGWTINTVWSNNEMGFTASQAYWEIRSGVSAGNGGTLVASGTNPATQTATGRIVQGSIEYTIQVTGLNVNLGQGTYWLTVVPIDSVGGAVSYITTTSGANASGSPPGNKGNSFINASAPYNYNFTPASDYIYNPVDFSMGVAGNAVPLPPTVLLLGSGLLGLVGWRRFRKG
jgi:hypothetical protein